jgi:macrolide transport system ATP-binding/permease protein
MQIPVLLGREIDARDSMNSPRVALVNEIFVKDYFASENPVGRRFRLDPDAKESPEIEIVGLVKATHYDSLTKEIPPTVYIPYTQDIARLNYVMFQLRTAGNPLAQATTVRHIVNETAPQVPVFMLMTQADQINRTMGRERTLAELCSCFAALTLAVACIGLYGTLAYSVSRRTNEIGIRMAVGASAARIQWTVLQEVLALSTIGIAIGLAAAWTLTRFIESFLFGMKARDPLAITVAIAILMLAGLIAGYAPAWRASRIDPMVALRHE